MTNKELFTAVHAACRIAKQKFGGSYSFYFAFYMKRKNRHYLTAPKETEYLTITASNNVKRAECAFISQFKQLSSLGVVTPTDVIYMSLKFLKNDLNKAIRIAQDGGVVTLLF